MGLVETKHWYKEKIIGIVNIKGFLESEFFFSVINHLRPTIDKNYDLNFINLYYDFWKILFKWSINELENHKTKKNILSYEVTEIYQIFININHVEKILHKVQYYGNTSFHSKRENFKNEFFTGFKNGINRVNVIIRKLKERFDESECSFISWKMDFHKVAIIIEEIINCMEKNEENKKVIEELQKKNSQKVNNLRGMFGETNNYEVAQRCIENSPRRITIIDNSN